MEVVQLSGVPLVDDPCLTVAQQCGENHCTVHLYLCLYGDPSSVSHIFVQSGKSNARLDKSSVHLVIDHNGARESDS